MSLDKETHHNSGAHDPAKKERNMSDESKCPVMHGANSQVKAGAWSNADWWPNQLNLNILHQHSSLSNPMDKNFNYAKEFNSLDLNAVVKDLHALMTSSQEWWPADFGHYGGLFIRMAWHGAGTYRIADGRGGAGRGQQRFAPVNSWPDNVSLDKARRLLWPIKQKYGRRSPGPTSSFSPATSRWSRWASRPLVSAAGARMCGNRIRMLTGAWRKPGWLTEPPSNSRNKKPSRRHRDGPDLRQSRRPGAQSRSALPPVPFIRETFARMAMNDEETVALIAGGHTFGKTHGAADPTKYVGREPEAAPIEEMGLGWKNSFGTGAGNDTITSGLEVTWTTKPTKWSHDFFEHLFNYDWELTTSPAGAYQWKPKGNAGAGTVPDAHDPSKSHQPAMLTTDLSLKFDPEYKRILAALQRSPRRICRRLRPCVVQADPPRHGSALPLPGSAGAEGGTDLAGPGSRRRS